MYPGQLGDGTLSAYKEENCVCHNVLLPCIVDKSGGISQYYYSSISLYRELRVSQYLFRSGINGYYLHRLDSGRTAAVSGPASRCTQWYANAYQLRGVAFFLHRFLPACPCSLFMAQRDWRFGLDRVFSMRSNGVCFFTNFAAVGSRVREA